MYAIIKGNMGREGEKMNRWTYFLISQRLKNGGKEQFRRRKSKARTVINIICGIFGIGMLVIITLYGGLVAILAGLGFFGIIFSFLFSMHHGKELLLTQSCIVKEQLNNDLPVEFNGAHVKWGFVLSFTPIYIMMFIMTLIPGGWLWFVPYLPFCIICLLLSHMSRGFVELFNYNIHKYNACHVGAHLFVLIVGGLIRQLVILPTTF